ncbi:linear amide C-N hydrolase [Shewanella schlegeliana]|uniref:Linear amide C-N hydrolase n=1 Tax=Shewanella schlegeliana TaxID=190308 RepID=A0ABS1STT0_9GAMM|nr:linear amide C-N hydrolase [Shewanella schlegeliana]MBL4911954.1 linear amide C-N hydrolase [Shewanella schlegeliana]MCL1110093.1 linear amide C-N hydrolase [Shewanella schlegeliana]GIU26720.1 choloylglycine hydrolase [Shewanella schlegeliana]
MCTRIFNSLNPEFPMTGRNFDWFSPLTTYLYRIPKSKELRTGSLKQQAHPVEFSNHDVFTWQAKYASIASLVGNDQLGLGSVDGINSQGLAVNGLEDLFAYFEDNDKIIDDGKIKPLALLKAIDKDRNAFLDQLNIPEDAQLLSSLRWVQFTLDCFDTVEAATSYFSQNPDQLYIYSDDVPDGLDTTTKAKLHLTLSDRNGDSAIIELRDNGFKIYHNRKYNVATVNPGYDVQLALLKPWQKKWQQEVHLQDTLAGFTLFDLPGGPVSQQRFARAAYYYEFSQPASNRQNALAQTRALMAATATPLCYNSMKHSSVKGQSSNTLWCSVSEHAALRYHLINTYSIAPVWVSFDNPSNNCERLLILERSSTGEAISSELMGDVQQQLRPCDNPFV